MKYNFTDDIVLLMICVVGITYGCDTSIDPLNEEKGEYSIYGHLDIDRSNNYIRIRNLNEPLSTDTSKGLGATVHFQNVDEGIAQALEDSVVVFDGLFTHNFRTEMEIRPDTEYRIEVHSPDRPPVHATATTPQIADVEVTPRDGGCGTIITMSFEPVKGPRYLDVSVGVRFEGSRFWASLSPANASSDGQQVSTRFSPQGVLDRIFRDLQDAINERHPVRCDDLDSNRFEVQYTHYGPDFFADISSDTLNVPGGTGRFGGLYRDTLSYDVRLE